MTQVKEDQGPEDFKEDHGDGDADCGIAAALTDAECRYNFPRPRPRPRPRGPFLGALTDGPALSNRHGNDLSPFGPTTQELTRRYFGLSN